jgi:hypothetical protein
MTLTNKRTLIKSTYAKGEVSYSKDSFVGNQALVFQIKFCGESSALQVVANRYFKQNYHKSRCPKP